ncbi:MAG TPA: hypothetical protein VI815_02270 [Candidatus Nanoarchaeia archaeon]|nr:hypothetical protein [Candidatus Nanoarchaeia archaeon]
MKTYVDVAAWLAGPGYKPVYIQCWIMHKYSDRVYARIKGFTLPGWIPKTYIITEKSS